MRARRQLKASPLHLPAHRDEAVLNAGGIRCASVLYDFSRDGGAIGDISFQRLLPEGCIAVKATLDIQTAVVGATSTVTLKAGSTTLSAATDLTALSGIAPLALTDVDGVKVAVSSELKISIAVAAITAGKVRIFVQYLLPND